jgi:glutamate--cysteine ligase
MLAEMRERREGFAPFARRLAEQHRDYFRGLELDPEREDWFKRLAEQSRNRQRAIESADDIDFDEFLRRYFAQTQSRPVALSPPPEG